MSEYHTLAAMKSKTYKISTIIDIYNKVPADRINTCCAELGALLSTTKKTVEFLALTAGVHGKKASDLVEFTLPLKWKDDGKGDIEAKFAMKEAKP